MAEEYKSSPEEGMVSNKAMRNLIQQARDMYNTMVKETEHSLEYSYNFKRTFLEESIVFTLDDLKKFTDEQIVALYEKYFDPTIPGAESEKRISVEDMREDLEQAKRMSNSVFQSKQEYEDIEKAYGEMLDEQWSLRNSKEHRQHMLDDLDTLKKQADLVTDEIEKKKILHKIEIMEASISLEFILTRIQTVTKKEHDKVMEQFFNEKEGSYTMERCASRIKKFGYEKEWYKYFFNLEEHYLPEEYYPFNNLFLFGMMRFIAYADPYSKEDQIYVKALINSLTGLIYHKLDSEVEERIIDLIKKYDDFYKEDLEYFKENNTTHPNHPIRIQYSQKNEADRKEALIKAMVSMQIPVPDDTMTADEMQKYYNEKLEEMIKNNTSNDETHGEAEVIENEDGSVSIRPSFNKDKYRNPVDCIEDKFYYYGPDVTKDTDLNTYEGDSFFNVYKILKSRGIKNCGCMLELLNPDVPTSWESSADLQPEELELVRKEASENIWYYLRFCTNHKFVLTVASMSLIYGMVHRVNTWACTPRQTGISYAYYYALSWFLLYKDTVNTLSFIGTDAAQSKAIVDVIINMLKNGGIDDVITNDPMTTYNVSKKKIRIDTLQSIDENDLADAYYFGDFEFIEGIDDLFADVKAPIWDKWLMFDSVPNDAYKVPNINKFLSNNAYCYHWMDESFDMLGMPEFDRMRNNNNVIYIEKKAGEDLLPFTDEEYKNRMNEMMRDANAYDREICLIRNVDISAGETVEVKPTPVDIITKKIDEEGTISVDEFLSQPIMKVDEPNENHRIISDGSIDLSTANTSGTIEK